MADSNLSPISLIDDDDCAKIVALNEAQEETTEVSTDLPNTQYVLEIAQLTTPKKNKGKQIVNQKKRQIVLMKKNPFYIWLETSWQSDVTMKIIKPWLNKINQVSLKEKDMNLYHVGRLITKIMKSFIEWMKSTKKQLPICGFDTFEEWACGDGFSMIFGKLQQMDLANDLNQKLFHHYSDAAMELEERQNELDEQQEAESLSLPNTKNISTSSMTAHTPGPIAGASTSTDYEITTQSIPKKTLKSGKIVNKQKFPKEKLHLKKRKNENSDDERDYENGDLFRTKQTQESVETESESDVEINPPMKRSKKVHFAKQTQESQSDSDLEIPNTDEDFACMVEDLARAHSLVKSTGKIWQSISVKDGDAYINLTSPGERGCMLVKLELYPFNDCVKLDRKQYWTKRTFTSLAVISSKDCPAYKKAMDLRAQLTKDISKIKGVRVERKSATGWKSG